jgi:hypothetical protein
MAFSRPRRTAFVVTLVTSCVVAAIVAMSGAPRSVRPTTPGAATEIRKALAYFDSVAPTTPGATGGHTPALAISLAYIERLRLGLGSPFRLVDHVLRDERLDPQLRERTAWALLGHLTRGDAYGIDAMVFAPPCGDRCDDSISAGSSHLGLIDQTIAGADDPRVGEQSVRLAYALAAAEGLITPGVAKTAVDVAALRRDRALAIRDVRALIGRTRWSGGPATLVALRQWRAERRFAVEQPAMSVASADDEWDAVDGAEELLRRLRRQTEAPPPAVARMQSGLGQATARRVMATGRKRPPQPATTLTLARLRPVLRAEAAWNRFDTAAVFAASNEEMLVGAHALATDSLVAPRSVARAVLAVAVGMRSLAQEQPWFAGEPGPTAADVMLDFGLAGVEIDDGIPAAWHPYYLRMVASALSDMRWALPSYSPSGLRIRIGADSLPRGALALHEPRTRTIRLTAATSAGALAHELAHDLDWQAARRMFATGGGYGTDRAVRGQTGKLAASVLSLTEARPVSGEALARTGMARPAEVFARGVDWFVASRMARAGRSNGYLTAVQDALIHGPVAGRPTAVGSHGVASLITALSEVAGVPDSVTRPLEAQWGGGDASSLDLSLYLERVLEIPLSAIRAAELTGVTDRRGAGFPVPMFACRSDGRGVGRRVAARDRLLELAVESRAMGTATRHARWYSFDRRPAWARSLLREAPWSGAEGERLVGQLRGAFRLAIRDQGLAQLGFAPIVPAPFTSAAGCQ